MVTATSGNGIKNALKRVGAGVTAGVGALAPAVSAGASTMAENMLVEDVPAMHTYLDSVIETPEQAAQRTVSKNDDFQIVAGLADGISDMVEAIAEIPKRKKEAEEIEELNNKLGVK